jgi:hypothetical protein
MRKHISRVHSKGDIREKQYYGIIMQTWFPKQTGGFGIWWAITPGLPPPQPSSPPALSSPLIIPNPHMEQHLIGTKQKDDRNLYIEQTSWRKIFQRQLYWQALRQATYVP